MKARFAAGLLAVVAMACAQPAVQPSPEIEAQSDRWLAAVNGGDIEALGELYTEDCRLLPPNGEMQTGPAAAQAIFGAMSDAGLTGDAETLQAAAAGDLGFRVGRYSIQAADGSDVDHGKFVEIWRLVQGEWKLANDIWNSDLPAGPIGSTVFFTHEVGDPDVWLNAWLGSDSRRELFADNGAPGVRIFQNTEAPNITGLLVDATDLEALQLMIASPEGQAAATEDTVQLDTIMVFAEVD